MYDLEIKTKHNTIHISVEKWKDIKEVLSMSYVLSYEIRKCEKPKYKILNKSSDKCLKQK